jgi:DNA (cytosine-5)-methyltransferase 1
VLVGAGSYVEARVRLLDLFSGAGGAAVGYARAGFEVVGVDIEPQPNYPFEFHQADAMTFPLEGFDAIHASPPCQHYSQMSLCRPGLAETYPDLVAPCRARLSGLDVPWVMENVAGSPLEGYVQICGTGLGMKVQRHRWFESNVALWGVPCAHGINAWNPKYKHATGRNRRRVPVIGEWRIPKALQDEAMEIDWMTLPELSEAIPPRYTEHLGTQVLAHLEAAA